MIDWDCERIWLECWRARCVFRGWCEGIPAYNTYSLMQRIKDRLQSSRLMMYQGLSFQYRIIRWTDLLKQISWSYHSSQKRVQGWDNLLCTLRMVQRTNQEATRISVRLCKWSTILWTSRWGKDVSYICWSCTTANAYDLVFSSHLCIHHIHCKNSLVKMTMSEG